MALLFGGGGGVKLGKNRVACIYLHAMDCFVSCAACCPLAKTGGEVTGLRYS